MFWLFFLLSVCSSLLLTPLLEWNGTLEIGGGIRWWWRGAARGESRVNGRAPLPECAISPAASHCHRVTHYLHLPLFGGRQRPTVWGCVCARAGMCVWHLGPSKGFREGWMDGGVGEHGWGCRRWGMQREIASRFSTPNAPLNTPLNLNLKHSVFAHHSTLLQSTAAYFVSCRLSMK